ncbi:MAG TPA: hypothetical protein VFB22_05230 [Candidatus Baltobacteraceae bacterium]|nr:hypothetical protein [Candidatus Baltobacteraceae bacterium]
MMRTASLLGCAALVVSTAFAVPAAADPSSETDVTVVTVGSSPVALTGCHSDAARRYGDVTNRAKEDLRSFSVDWSFYDKHEKKIGGGELEYQLDPPLEPGDSGSFYQEVPIDGFSLKRETHVERVTCRISHAVFTGAKRWAYGKRWPEPLLALDKPSPGGPSDDPRTSANGVTGGPGPRGPSGITLTVLKGWNDLATPGLFVHDTIVVHGGTSDQVITPENFVLMVKLPNGGLKMYDAMMSPAPVYTKMNAMGIVYPARTVDVSEDLGSMGTLMVPAGGTVKITVTFIVPEGLSDPTANTNVLLR